MILEGFAGPGGWSQGAKRLGLSPVGFELDAAACLTRITAGHFTVRADVSHVPLTHLRGQVQGVILSPPCQDFSLAGKKAGIEGYRGRLVFEVIRWAMELQPEWIACEQVPTVLPIWHDFAFSLQQMGYNTWVGKVNAADYGVPQIRKRAILMASRRKFKPPPPTHTAGGDSDDLFGSSLLPHVTMAEALGWGLIDRPTGTVVAGSNRTGGVACLDGGAGAREIYNRAKREGNWQSKEEEESECKKRGLVNTGRDWKEGGTRDDAQKIDPHAQPAPTVMGSSDRWRVEAADVKLQPGSWADGRGGNRRLYDPNTEPAPTVCIGHDSAAWAWVRPSTTIVGSFRPDIVAPPGWRVDPDVPRQNAPGAVQVTIAEAAVLQGFPPNYPWQGSKTKRWEQVGNAIPPPLAEAILKELAV